MSNTDNNTVTETETATEKKSVGNKYPFVTKKQIAERLAGSAAFQQECLMTLYTRQTEHEQSTGSTKVKNARGFMASHAKRGTELAQKLQSGEELSADEVSEVGSIVSRYTKQLAAAFRAEAISKNPDLASETACFFKPQA